MKIAPQARSVDADVTIKPGRCGLHLPADRVSVMIPGSEGENDGLCK